MQRVAFFRFLRRRNSVLIIVFLLSFVLGLDLLWYFPTKQSLRNSASDLSLEVAESAGSYARASLQNDLSRIENAARDIQEDPDRNTKVLERLIARNPSLLNATLIDKNGASLMHAGPPPAEVAVPDYSKLPGTYLALGGTSNFGDVFNQQDGTPVSFVAVPVKSGSEVMQVLIVEVSFAHLAEILNSYKGGSWRIYVTDKNGVEFIGPAAHTRQATSLISRPLVQKVVVDGLIENGLAPEDAYTNEAGIRAFAVGMPIPIANWSLFVERPQKEALKQESTIGWVAVAIFLLGALVIIVAMGSYWRLTLLNETLQEVDKMKSEFLSVAAHQLRTPLSALKWSFEALLDNEHLDPAQRSIMMKGNDSNERMIRLVEDMLAVTRIEANKVRYAFAPLHIEDVIDNVFLDFISRARAYNLTLSFERAENRLSYIAADPERMHDILGNLLENAIRYTPANGSIVVRAVEERGFIKVSVADTGIGVPPAQQANIFDKFFRADNAARIQTDGSGLGLFIVKSMVEKHGGKIWFESEMGRGTTFFFTIPTRTDS